MDSTISLLASQGQAVYKAFSSVSSLRELYSAYRTIPARWQLLAHCLYISTLADDLKHLPFLHYWSCLMSGFGGGILSAYLMMSPAKAPVALFTNNDVGLFFTAAWWLMTCAPFNLVRGAYKYSPIKYVAKIGTTLMRSGLIISRVDAALELFPGVITAPLFFGTMAGCGGKLSMDMVRHGWGMLATPAELSQPSFVMRSGMLGAVWYYGAAYVTKALSKEEAAAVLITVLCVHALLSELVPAQLADFTAPVFRVAHAVSLVPVPGAAAKPAAKVVKPKSQAPKPAAAQKLAAAPAGAGVPKPVVTANAVPSSKALPAAVPASSTSAKQGGGQQGGKSSAKAAESKKAK